MRSAQTTNDPIRLAVIGAGVFAREAHLPALLALDGVFAIKAVFSRTLAAARELASLVPDAVDAYDSLDAILARPDIDAVDVVLPIPALPGAVGQALTAGKHVMSEKPIAPDVAAGRRLLEAHARNSGLVWMIGENIRYDRAHVQAKELIDGGAIGRTLLCDYVVQMAMDPRVKYYRTTWRRDGSVPGGVLLDGGIHHAAELRFLVGEVTSVSATVVQMRSDLQPADTMSATLQFENGAAGSYAATYAAAERTNRGVLVVGDRGALRVHNLEIELTVGSTTTRIPFAFNHSYREDTRAELAAFAASIRQGEPNRNSPQECLRDLALFEAMLRSASSGRRERPESI